MLIATLALAATPHVGVQYAALAARFVGDLSAQTTLAHSVQIKAMYIDGAEWPLRAYLAIDTFWTGAQHQGDAFGYPPGADLDVLGFLFIPHLCWRPELPLTACLGLGQGTVNINAARDRRDWGTWNYQLQLDVALGDHATAFVIGKAVGRIEQAIDGVQAQATILMLGGGVGGHF